MQLIKTFIEVILIVASVSSFRIDYEKQAFHYLQNELENALNNPKIPTDRHQNEQEIRQEYLLSKIITQKLIDPMPNIDKFQETADRKLNEIDYDNKLHEIFTSDRKLNENEAENESPEGVFTDWELPENQANNESPEPVIPHWEFNENHEDNKLHEASGEENNEDEYVAICDDGTGVSDSDYHEIPMKVDDILDHNLATSSEEEPKSKFLATEKIEAEKMTHGHISCFSTMNCRKRGIAYVGCNQYNAHMRYEKVDFGSGVVMVTLRVASWVSNDVSMAYIHLRLDDVTNEPLVSVPIRTIVPSQECAFYTLTAFLPTSPTGVHDLYFTFSQPQKIPFVNIDWFVFNSTVSVEL